MSIPGVGAVGFTPYVAPKVDLTSVVNGPTGPSGTQRSGADFGSMVLQGLDNLQQVQHKSDGLAVKAATGDLQSIHDYTIAATQAAVTTQVTVAVRNKAVEAFNEIMRMQA